MAVIATNQQGVAHRKEMTAEHALQIAWWTWCAMLVVPFFFFISTVWHLMDHESNPAAEASTAWFIFAMAYMILAVPAAFFWRSHTFRGYWEGRVVHPRHYLVGMISIWAAFEIGGFIALLGVWMTGDMLPNILPAVVAFMLFVPLWPNGHAMTRPLNDEHDSGDYEEPR